jgi:isoleucyl-tRNA synthetase
MARIARDLTLLMAPVLPFTADEVWPLLPGKPSGSVHFAHFPAAAGLKAPEELDALLAARTLALKALEEARAAKVIGKSLEAKVVVRGSDAALAPLRAWEARPSVFPGNLANLFIVSEVVLESAEGSTAVEVTRADGRRCERCWTWSPQVTGDEAPLCPRCLPVVEALS